MRAKQVMSLLSKTIAAGLPVMIKGAPGIGKTDVVVQAAKNAEAEVVLMHPVVCDPTDFKGLPGIVNGGAEFLPYGELRKLMTAKKRTVCFFDDLGQAPAAVQAAAMQLFLAREINGKRISDHVVFVAATNRREDRAGVTGILEPVKSRFATIVELQATVDDWCEWALDNNVPVELVALLRWKPTLMETPAAVTNDIVNRVSPRTVTNLGRLYSLGIDDLESLGGAAGEGFAAEFVGFMKVYKSLPNIDAILLKPDTAPIPEEVSALYAVATTLAHKTTKDNASKVIRYLSRLKDEFGILGVRDAARKCKDVEKCPEYVKFAIGKAELLV